MTGAASLVSPERDTSVCSASTSISARTAASPSEMRPLITGDTPLHTQCSVSSHVRRCPFTTAERTRLTLLTPSPVPTAPIPATQSSPCRSMSMRSTQTSALRLSVRYALHFPTETLTLCLTTSLSTWP